MIDDGRLHSRLQSGGRVTLVLGAGVSRSRGVPLWSDLLRETWNAVRDKDPYGPEIELLERARHACEREGLPKSFVERLDIRRHPLETQFAFEQIYAGLRWEDGRALRKKLGLPRQGRQRSGHAGLNEQDVAELFVEILRKVLYQGLTRRTRGRGARDTLSLVAEAVRRSAMRPEHERRIAQVITFNVDDLLEREVNGSRRRFYLAQPICRASDFRPPARRAIPVYHLHGFVPLKANSYTIDKADGSVDADPSAESLVFTDEQYWRMVGNPTGFASRIFCNALSDCCVFVGLSMTDINIIRWLAQDAIERSDDVRRLRTDWSVSEMEFDLGEELSRHYWITQGPIRSRRRSEESARAEEESLRFDVVASTLGRRGVERIAIPSWDSKVFHDWWKKCFWM
jgi:SIR2-like domain